MAEWKRRLLNLTESFRSAAEYKKLQRVWDDCLARAPSGDGHPVLILPGFAADDRMTEPLRKALTEKGYKACAWEGGRNMGLNDRTTAHLRDRLAQVFKENGNRKVTLIGHSLGGIYARELAREFPEMVRGVMTVGTPFGVGMAKNAVPNPLSVFVKMLSKTDLSLDEQDMAQRVLTPPPVPTTSIFSKEDGIAGWRACLNPAALQAENIEVSSSHVGLIWSAKTFGIVLERLSQPEGGWKPFTGASKDAAPKNPDWKPGKLSSADLFKKK